MDRLTSGIDGLVLSQLERKQGRLTIVMSFLLDFDLMTFREEEILKDLDIKLVMAINLRKNHEMLKHDFTREQNSVIGGNATRLSLGLRLMNFALRNTALRVHGYDEDKLRSQGVTPTHIIYSKISTFDTFLQTLMQVALSPDAQS